MGRKLYVALIIFFILSQFVIFGVSREAWFDVSFSLETVNQMRDGRDIDFRSWDVHPPTYYYLLYGWTYLNLGMSEYYWAQEMSVVFMLAFLVFAYLSFSKLFGRNGEWAIVLLSLGSTYVHFGTEARSYAVLLFLSALILYSLVEGLKGYWRYVGCVAIFLPVMLHYYTGAIMYVFFVMVAVILYFRKRIDLYSLFGFVISGLLGFILALTYAIPQRMRVEGTWFEPPFVTSWPDSLIFSFFMNEGVSKSWIVPVFIVYFAFIVLMVFVFREALHRMVPKDFDPKMSDADVFFILICVGASFPLLGMAGAPLLGGHGFSNLYHHRFFLGVTWLFAAICLVFLFEKVKSFWKVFVPVVVLSVLFLFVYCVSAHHELENLMAETPCEPVVIMHESPFSSLTYKVYSREHNCGWLNFVSTGKTPKMLNGGGGDAHGLGEIFYNKTLPGGVDYYYVYGTGSIPIDGNVSLVMQEDGVSLLFVKRAVHLDGEKVVGVYFDNSSNYTRYVWG